MKNEHWKCEVVQFALRSFLAVAGFLLCHTAASVHAQSAPFTTTQQAGGTLNIINGFIVGASVTNGGAGYPQTPWVTITDSTGSNAIIVAAISGNGVVTNLTIKNAGSHYSSAVTLVIAPPPVNASLIDINVILQSYLSENMRTLTSGTNYPVGGTYTNYAGVTFYLAAYPGITNGLGAIWTGLGSLAAPVVTNIPVSITNAVTVYTVMNSYDGKLRVTNGALNFYGNGGAKASFDIIQGDNIRDHYNGSFQDVVAPNIMSLYWGSNSQVRLDCQGWMLPPAFFSQTLTNIQFQSYGNEPNGVPMIAAITVRTVGPAVTVQPTDGSAICSWPSTPTNYVLQSATDPSSTSDTWLTVTNLYVVTNNQCRVTCPVTSSCQLFRLISQP